MSMTLMEALQTPEVRDFIAAEIAREVDEALRVQLPALVEARVAAIGPRLREAAHAEAHAEVEHERLALKARRLIDDARGLTPAAKQRLLESYSVRAGTPGTGLALIEAVTATNGTVLKTSDKVLAEAVERDAAELRAVIAEAAPTVPSVPGGAGFAGDAAAGVGRSAWDTAAEKHGIDSAALGVGATEAA